MKVEALKKDRLNDFFVYCRKHRCEVDDSFLYEEQLKLFVPNEENPSYIVTNEQQEIIAAASLIIDEYQRRGERARFRIFHSEMNDFACYSMLLQALLQHTKGLKKIYLFVPLTNKLLAAHIEQLDFSIERYAFLMVREDMGVPGFTCPEDYVIRDLIPGRDEEIWCKVRNAAFANLRGNETPITPEMVAKVVSDCDYLDGGMKILFHREKPVGVVLGTADEYENAPIMNIGPLAIIPEYQGRGLGRLLLRAILQYAKEKDYQRTILSVNGENERAQALYLQEGFQQVEGVVCYEYYLTK